MWSWSTSGNQNDYNLDSMVPLLSCWILPEECSCLQVSLDRKTSISFEHHVPNVRYGCLCLWLTHVVEHFWKKIGVWVEFHIVYFILYISCRSFWRLLSSDGVLNPCKKSCLFTFVHFGVVRERGEEGVGNVLSNVNHAESWGSGIGWGREQSPVVPQRCTTTSIQFTTFLPLPR